MRPPPGLRRINNREESRAAADGVCECPGTGTRTMRRSSRRKALTLGRLAQRVDRAAGDLNPFLLAIAIGLLILNLTCLITLRFIDVPSPRTADPLPAAVVSLRDPAG